MLKMSCAKCPGLSPECVSQPKIAEKFIKNPYFEGSRSFKVIDVDSNKKLVTSASYDKQHVCAYRRPP